MTLAEREEHILLERDSHSHVCLCKCIYLSAVILRQSPVTICYISINILENLHKMLKALEFQEQDQPQKKRQTSGEHKIKINS